jgi:hypothetical protein
MPKTDSIMKRWRFIWLLALLAFPAWCFAQDEGDTPVDIEAFVTQVNEKCPITYSEGWAVNSCTLTDDTVSLVMGVPANFGFVLPMLTGNAENVKRLWIKQLSQYGAQWNQFVDMLVSSNKALKLVLKPEDSNSEGVILFEPANFKKE